MSKVCILNSTTNIVENILIVDDINNVPSFAIGTGQVLASNHTGNIGDTWNGSSYVPATEEDLRTDTQKWAEIRFERNKLLAETDWTQARDVTLSNDSAWQTYRQQLRDLPSKITPKFLANSPRIDESEFPTEPS